MKMEEKHDKIEFILSRLREPERLLDEEFMDWLLVEENKRLFEEVILNREAFLKKEYGEQISASEEWQKFLQRIQRRNKTLPKKQKRIQPRIGRRAWLSAVACACVAVSVVGGLLLQQHWGKQETVQVAEELHVGKRSATLIVEPGKAYDLTNKELQLATPQGMRIMNDSSNMLSYQNITKTPSGGQTKAEEATVIDYHILKIPESANYAVTLSDGTKIWLNCETTLRFPQQFREGEPREVFLDGEAYFEVIHADGWEFLVHTEKMNVQVTGTRFNVKAYSTEEVVQTTLVEGAVWAYVGKESVLLKPSEQFQLNKNTGQTMVQQVDTELYTGWIHDMFVFRNQRLENVMNELARWYKMTVFYSNPEAKEIRFSANLDKYQDIDDLLEIINESGKVIAVRKANTITIQTR